jgi:hypothetical protein
MSQPGIEPWPPRWEYSSKELLEQRFNKLFGTSTYEPLAILLFMNIFRGFCIFLDREYGGVVVKMVALLRR